VRTQIKSDRPEPYMIDYRLRSKGSTWLVIDVIIERVSMISNFRSQAQEIIGKEGPEGLIRSLKEKNTEREKAGQA
jgi:phospholipid transport system substrate-binding protein